MLAIAANIAIALVAVPVLARMGTFPSYAMLETGGSGQSMQGQPLYMPNGAVTNIYPYSRDGKPLTDVLLYDQDGRPLTIGPKIGDVTTDYPTGADGQPITNAYPLRQRHFYGDPVAAPRVALPPWPSASPMASPTASPTSSPTR
jgi:hypothetical protein